MAARIRFSDTGYAVPSAFANRLTLSSSTIHPTSRTGAERRSTTRQGVEQVGIRDLDPVHHLLVGRVAGQGSRRGGRLLEPLQHRSQVAPQVRQVGQSGVGHEAGVDEAVELGADVRDERGGGRRRQAVEPQPDLVGRRQHRLDLGDDGQHPRRDVGPDGAEHLPEGSGVANTPHRRPGPSAARSRTIASTAQARASSSRAGTEPCGLSPRASFCALLSERQHPLPRRGGVEQQQPAHAQDGRGVSLPLTSHHHEVDGVATVHRAQDSPGPSDPRTVDSKVRGRSPKSHCRRPFRSTAAPARDIRRCTWPASCVLQDGEVLAAAEHPAGAVLDREGDAQVVGHPVGSELLGRHHDARCGRAAPGRARPPACGPPPGCACARAAAAWSGAGTKCTRVAFGSDRSRAVASSSRSPGTCQSNPSSVTWLSTCTGMWTVTPSAAAPGSNW